MVDGMVLDARVGVTVDAMVEELHYIQVKPLGCTINQVKQLP